MRPTRRLLVFPVLFAAAACAAPASERAAVAPEAERPLDVVITDAAELRETGRPGDAEEVLRAALGREGLSDHDTARLHLQMALAMRDEGRLENAVEHAAMARKLRPDWGDAREVMQDAKERLAAQRETTAGNRPAREPANVGAALEKGHALEEAERWKDAELVYRETLKQQGVGGRDAARLHVRMAFLMSRAGRDENAVEHAAMAHKLAPDWDDAEEVLQEMQRRWDERKAAGRTGAAKEGKKRAAKAPLTDEQRARAAKKRDAAVAEAEALRKKAGELKETAHRLEIERNELREHVKELEAVVTELRERVAELEKASTEERK